MTGLKIVEGVMRTSSVIFAAMVVAFVGYWISSYNTMVGMQKEMQDSWTQVQLTYQSRADLIPALVTTVKDQTKNENVILEAVSKAREATLQKPQASLPTTNQLQQFDQTQQTLSAALNRLLMLGDKYPNLKTDPSFISLQGQLAGIENRILVARSNYRYAAQDYNPYISKFPHNVIAAKLGYKLAPSFPEETNSETIVEVKVAQ